MTRRRSGVAALACLGLALLLLLPPTSARAAAPNPVPTRGTAPANVTPVSNFSAAVGRLVTLVGAAGGALLAMVWARVALSWFSNDLSKKIQAKDRARDALIGTLIFTAAVSGLVWALAQWVVSGA